MSDNIREDLKKALHRAMAVAYHAGNPTVKKAVDTSNSDTLKGIINDLKDPNSQPEVNPDLLPVDKEAVLNKDMKKEPNAIAQAYDLGQDQKKAALGMQTNPHPEMKEARPLKSFMSARSAKMEKAKVDEGKPLEDKVRDRQARNDRSVKETKTPSGQSHRTSHTSHKREKELEVGHAHYDKPDAQGRPQRVRGIPAERRKGEKISGTPRTMQTGHKNPIKTSAEATYGVHMHSGSMAGRNLPVGGGKNSSAPTSADKHGKSYVVGGGAGGPHMTAHARHSAVMHGQNHIKPSLGKSDPHHGLNTAKHGLKAAALKVKHEHEKAHLATQKPKKQMMEKGLKETVKHGAAKIGHAVKGIGMEVGHVANQFGHGLSDPFGQTSHAKEYRQTQKKIDQHWENPPKKSMEKANPDRIGQSHEKGVHLRSIMPHRSHVKHEDKNSSYAGDEVRSSKMATNSKAMGNAKQVHSKVLSDIRSMPKPNLGKARVDEGKRSSEKIQARNERHERVIHSRENGAIPKVAGHRHPEKGVHPSMKDLGYHDASQSRAGISARIASRKDVHPDVKNYATQEAKGKHKTALAELHGMPKPALDKARVDEGKSPESKVQAREARNARFPKNWRTKNPKHEGQFAGERKSEVSEQSGVHHGKGAYQIGNQGSFRDKGGKRDKIDVQAAHTMAMKGIRKLKPNLGKDEGDMSGGMDMGSVGGMDMMAMAEHKPKSAPMLRKIANKMKARKLCVPTMQKKEVK